MDDNKLEMHIELNNARYRQAYENIKALKQYTESSSRSIQTTTDVDRKNDMESFMKMMMLQQFQQQNLLYQSALLNTLTKEERAQYITHYFPYGDIMKSDVEREKKLLALENKDENASKLRIFGYIHLFAVIIKQSMIQPPFRLSNEASFTIMLRYSVNYLADSLKDSEKPLFAINKKSTIYAMLKKDQIYPKNYFITLEKTQINLTETRMLSTITLYEAKLLIFGLVFLRIVIIKLFLGFELGLSNATMTPNKISINNKLLGSICTYIYRKVMADIISERTRTTDLPIPGELQNMVFNDTEMKQIYGMIGRRYLANYIDKCKRWLQDYGKAILTL
uniref:Peroxisomal membrane protein PEX16 n=1 Tax=Schistosoma mansoni TaxID=6183 RepID=A0A3Q0KSW0_SCHMA